MGNSQEVNIISGFMAIKGILQSIRNYTYNIEADIDSNLDEINNMLRVIENKDIIGVNDERVEECKEHIKTYAEEVICKYHPITGIERIEKPIHFDKCKRRKVKWNNSKDAFLNAVSKVNSMAHLIKELKIISGGGTREMLRKYIDKYEADTSHWKNNLKAGTQNG